MTFKGLTEESFKTNFVEIPYFFFDEVLAYMTSIDQVKVLMYLLRYTWTFESYKKYGLLSVKDISSGYTLSNETKKNKGTGVPEESVWVILEGLIVMNLVEVIGINADKDPNARRFKVKWHIQDGDK